MQYYLITDQYNKLLNTIHVTDFYKNLETWHIYKVLEPE